MKNQQIPSALKISLIYALTRTSRNQKGKVAQGVACQRQEKRDKREALPTATFPRAYFSRLILTVRLALRLTVSK